LLGRTPKHSTSQQAGGKPTFDEADNHRQSAGPEIPAAKLLGSDVLYPFDFVSQSEDVFPSPHSPVSNPSLQPRALQKKHPLAGLGRLLGMAFLFIACLAFPFMIPVVYAFRRGGRR
jgi:hypothetical protein